MGRIIAELMDDKIVVTKYESPDGFVIPNSISQKKNLVAIIKKNLDVDGVEELSPEDLAVTRQEFLMKLLNSSPECRDKYCYYGKGLYSYNDMTKGITWAEASYLLLYTGVLNHSISDWNTIKPDSRYKVCVLSEIQEDGSKVLDERLASYKNRLDMENYIKAIKDGKRYIPLIIYCSFIDVCSNSAINVNLSKDMLFKKVSMQELKELLG